MNGPLLCRLLSLIAVLIGGSMAFSLPWAWPVFGGQWDDERKGFFGLLGAMVVCLAVAALLRYFGRNAKGHLFRKEAMAVVGLSWMLATVLGGLPYVFSGALRAPGVSMSLVDAMFEAQSGFSTTGATVLTELEDRELVPRCVLFWRSLSNSNASWFCCSGLSSYHRPYFSRYSSAPREPWSPMPRSRSACFSLYVQPNARPPTTSSAKPRITHVRSMIQIYSKVLLWRICSFNRLSRPSS